MISRTGLWLSRIFRNLIPDPFVIAIVLTLVVAAAALVWGQFQPGEDRWLELLGAWSDSKTGLWKLLGFAMQMSLILLTGAVLAASKPVRLMISRVAGLPRSTATAAAMVGVIAASVGLLNWGLGLIVGALLAREVGMRLKERGIHAHYPLIAAAGYMGMLTWHGGLSGSAPLSMTTTSGAEKVLPAEYVAEIGTIQLEATIFSPLNLIVSLGLLILIPTFLALLAPSQASDMQPIDGFRPLEEKPFQPPSETGVPRILNTSWIVAWILGIALLLAVGRYIALRGIGSLGLDQVIMIMFAFGLLLHASPAAYMHAATDAARGCAGIIVQFPLYAGIMAMMAAAGLVAMIASGFVAAGTAETMPLLSFLAAGIVNIFVPSGGGQWAIQGPIALQSGLDAGVAPGKMVMAVAYGDELTNMLQPFWALPLLAITGVRARDIVGYTAMVMLVAGAWMALWLLVWN
ncbi:MAG: TIGR00366 family protein [Phycisphaerales bacterium]|nr:TIGR00366 family protein [Phycisphaerales bacterium]